MNYIRILTGDKVKVNFRRTMTRAESFTEETKSMKVSVRKTDLRQVPHHPPETSGRVICKDPPQTTSGIEEYLWPE